MIFRANPAAQEWLKHTAQTDPDAGAQSGGTTPFCGTGGEIGPNCGEIPTGKILKKPFDSSAHSAILKAEIEHGGVRPE
jgi:hypothetical protein